MGDKIGSSTFKPDFQGPREISWYVVLGSFLVTLCCENLGPWHLGGTLETAHHTGCWSSCIFMPWLVLSVPGMEKGEYRAILGVPGTSVLQVPHGLTWCLIDGILQASEAPGGQCAPIPRGEDPSGRSTAV